MAAEPAKQSWWAAFLPSPRVAFAASMLLLLTVWMSYRPEQPLPFDVKEADLQMMQDMTVLEDHDVISNFEPLRDLPAPVQATEIEDTNQPM